MNVMKKIVCGIALAGIAVFPATAGEHGGHHRHHEGNNGVRLAAEIVENPLAEPRQFGLPARNDFVERGADALLQLKGLDGVPGVCLGFLFHGAGNGADCEVRTRDLRLGKPPLYQLS